MTLLSDAKVRTKHRLQELSIYLMPGGRVRRCTMQAVFCCLQAPVAENALLSIAGQCSRLQPIISLSKRKGGRGERRERNCVAQEAREENGRPTLRRSMLAAYAAATS